MNKQTNPDQDGANPLSWLRRFLMPRKGDDMKTNNLGNMIYLTGIAFVLMIIPVLALWTERSLEFWLSYFKGTEVDAPYWLCLILTLFPPTLPANILSELIKLAV